MKQLTVISGKGGTGKTSVTASLAVLTEKVVMADCDVDAADLHLVLAPRILSRQPFSGGKQAWIDASICAMCQHCVDLCRFEAVHCSGETCSIDGTACEGCGVCARFCPTGAIRFEDAQNGEWYLSETRVGPMVHARLGIAEENSGKLVSLVRDEARKIANRQQRNTIIIDGSPGTGCPVIASITGTDLALLVTEPTLSGLHDMERVADLTEHFRIPTMIAINKWDINPELTSRIEATAAHRHLMVGGRIRYDRCVTEAQIRGRAVVELAEAPAAADLENLWHSVQKVLHPGT